MGDMEVHNEEASDTCAPPISTCKLIAFDNQVAGHQFEGGHLGSLVDDSGNFFKPLQDGARGEREVRFYERFWADENVPTNVKRFFPRYYGTVEVPNPSATGTTTHIILQDVSRGLQHPCIMDIKMGFRTWYPNASEAYNIKCRKKDGESTSASLGFRICGLQVYDAAAGSFWKADRNWCRNLAPSAVDAVLKRFVSTNPFDDANPDAAKADSVYGGPNGVISKLKELQNWFEVQTSYHFASSSILLIYEGDPTLLGNGLGQEAELVRIKLIDFAHVSYDQEGIDDNFLNASNSLTSCLSSIVETTR